MSRVGVIRYLNRFNMRMSSRPQPGRDDLSAGVVERNRHGQVVLKDCTMEQTVGFRMATVHLLRLAKQRMTYRELRSLTGLQQTVLSRYVKGHVIPSVERAVRIWRRLEPICGLRATLLRAVKAVWPVVDLQMVIGDPGVLYLAAADCLIKYAGHRVTKIVTVAVNGIPLAATVAQLMNVRLCIARPSRPVDGGELLEAVYTRNGERVELLYLPSRLVRHFDSVLIVDDMVRTGRTVMAIQRLLGKVKPKNGRKTEVAGVYCLIGFRDAVQRLREQGLRVETALEVVG